MTALSPFLVSAELKERVWGGTRFGKHDPPFGEAWVVYDQGRIATGSFTGRTLADAVADAPVDMLGASVASREGKTFPLLIKLLDPVAWLSVQVHPDDELALTIEGSGFRGKTEAWYVLDADPSAELIAGLVNESMPGGVEEAIRADALDSHLARHTVRPGDSLLVEAGLIHALGPGSFIYEVQQSSDLTYRVSDWGRPVSAGRELHIEQSVRASKPELAPQFAPMVKRLPNGSLRVLGCQYFALDLVDSDGRSIERDTELRSFAAVTIIEGSAELVSARERLPMERFASAIVPAATGNYRLESDSPFQALVSTVP